MLIDTGGCAVPQRALLAWLAQSFREPIDGYGLRWWLELTLDEDDVGEDITDFEGWLIHYDEPGDGEDTITLALVPASYDRDGRARAEFDADVWAEEGLPSLTVPIDDIARIVIP